MASKGVERIDTAEGDDFDPNTQEAMSTMPCPGGDKKPGAVATVWQVGYFISSLYLGADTQPPPFKPIAGAVRVGCFLAGGALERRGHAWLITTQAASGCFSCARYWVAAFSASML